MIELRAANTVDVDDLLLIPWPDWRYRRVIVLDKRRTPDGSIHFTVRPYEGDDVAVVMHLGRLPLELVEIVVKGTQKEWDRDAPAREQLREIGRKRAGG